MVAMATSQLSWPSPPLPAKYNYHDSNFVSTNISSRQTSPKFRSCLKRDEAMVAPFNVFITSSTKGIGYVLAKEFLKAGDNVIISSRSTVRVESVVDNLRGEFGEQRVWCTTCDIREGQNVKDLAAFAQLNLNYVDTWINNPGSNAYSYKPLAEASDEDLIDIVTINTLGLMICCRESIKMMLNQPRGGIYSTLMGLVQMEDQLLDLLRTGKQSGVWCI